MIGYVNECGGRMTTQLATEPSNIRGFMCIKRLLSAMQFVFVVVFLNCAHVIALPGFTD